MTTAVEWLFNQLSINNMALDKCTRAHQEMEQKILEKAKEMEKKQIVDTYVVGYGKGITHGAINAEQYYNETFKQ
jgi:hypothetical protein